jgi:AcrR family transcriptional regulator
MAKRRLSPALVAEYAVVLVDRDGFEALTMSAIAGELGVGPSALYSHVEGLEGLRQLVAVTATGNLTTSLNRAAIGTSGDEAVTAMGAAYRGFALEHPGQFASTLLPPRTEDDQLAMANRSLLEVFVLVFGAMGLGADQAHLAGRSTQCAIHGFLALEFNAGTTADHEAEFNHLLDALQRGLGSMI